MSTALASELLAETPTAGVAVWTGLTGLAVAMGIGRFAFTPLLPLMQRDAGVSLGAGQLVRDRELCGVPRWGFDLDFIAAGAGARH